MIVNDGGEHTRAARCDLYHVTTHTGVIRGFPIVTLGEATADLQATQRQQQ
jgi:hypothetical protein